MSLEIALAENTAAIRELIAKLSAGAIIPHDAVQTVDTTAAKGAAAEKKSTKGRKETPAATTEQADEAQSSDATPNVSDNSENSSDATAHGNPEATYDDAKHAVLRISKANGRDAAVEVLQRFGVAKLPDMLPQSYGDLVAMVNEMLGAE